MNEQQASDLIDVTTNTIDSQLYEYNDYESAINTQDCAVYLLIENGLCNTAWLLIQSASYLFNSYLDKQWGID